MKCCENCMNNPNNNSYASGFCNCALPAMEMNSPRRMYEISWLPTWTQTTAGTLTKTGNYTLSWYTDDAFLRE